MSDAATELNTAPAPTPTPTPSATPAPTPTTTPAPTPTASVTEQAPAWLAGLPEDMRADATLAMVPDVPTLAKNYLDTRAHARNRIAIPTDEAGFRELGEKLRPEKPEDYGIEFGGLGAGDPELATDFAKFAHDTGLPKEWAKGAANFYEQRTADQMSKLKSENTQGIEAVKLDLGPVAYQTRVEAVNNMLQKAGIEDFDIVSGLQIAVGGEEGKPSAERVLRAFFKLAEASGEVEKVDGQSVSLALGQTTPEQATAEIERMFGDDTIAAKLRDKNSAEYAKYQKLVQIQAKG